MTPPDAPGPDRWGTGVPPAPGVPRRDDCAAGATKLSVWMITYNHRNFIAQAIESALAQKTSFDYEIVIGDDCSTDGTREIVADYAARHPDRIRAILHPRNVGMHVNCVQSLQACRGEYVAMLEGDDYWTCPHKLQRQVELLDAEPGCAMCFHNAYNLHPDGRTEEFVPREALGGRLRFGLADLVTVNLTPTCSKVVRRSALEYPDLLYRVPGPDTLLNVIVARHGKVAYIDEIWAVRRLHAGGAYAGKNAAERIRHQITSLDAINRFLDRQFDAQILQSLLDMAWSFYWRRDWELFRIVRDYLRGRPEDPQAAELACLKIYPAWLYRLKDFIDRFRKGPDRHAAR